MRKTKRVLSLLLAFVMLFALAVQLVACGGSSSTDETTGDEGGTDTPTNATYSVVLKTAGGMALSDVLVYIHNEDDFIVDRATTNENGTVSFNLAASASYTVELSGVPEGYVVKDRYELGTNGLTIVLSSNVIEDTDHSGVSYKVGSIMHDFEVTLTDGSTFRLSEALKTKKAVVLNFWYTTCTYCVEEFPDMNEAYIEYKDDIALIALNNYYSDTFAEVVDFKENYYGYALDIPMAKDTAGVEDAFNVPGNPVTVVIDRYGMVSLYHTGAIPSVKYFTNMFEHYISDDYRQGLYNDIAELIPAAKPDKEMASSDEMAAILNKGEITVTYYPETESADAEYSWPFEKTEKDGVVCVRPSNIDLDNSFATLHAKVTLKKGEAFMFDYFASTQDGYDILYVLVDGDDIYQITGESKKWNECCPWVADADGEYDVTFVYYKDVSDSAGDDCVYLKDFRVVDESEVKVASYIPRQAATNPTEDMTDYQNYVTVVYNEDDFYYHVGDKNGPILLAKLIYGSNFSDTSVTENLYSEETFMVDGVDRFLYLEKYCNYAANSKIYTLCSVTEELKGYLEAYVAKYSFTTPHENTWLQLCYYYDSFGQNEDGTPVAEFEDPIAGLTSFNAFRAVEDEPNTVSYIGMNILPRGYLYAFVPERSGVYRITTTSSQEVVGWIFTGDHTSWIEAGDRTLYTHSDTGERFNPALLIDTGRKDADGNAIYERDNTNASMVAYMEAGSTYYIDFAYYDIYGAGSFTFTVSYIDETFDFFHEASPGVFTYIEGVNGEIGDTIAGGIDVILGDDGYYHHKLEDGSCGSIVYADFYMYTNIFTSTALKDMVGSAALRFDMSEDDHIALAAWEQVGKDEDALKAYWGDDFDYNWEYYQMEDIIKGVFHGSGEDMNEALAVYVDKMLDEEAYPERQGCVPVDETLAKILQALMDKYTFKNVDHSWTKLCYYYEYLGYNAAD